MQNLMQNLKPRYKYAVIGALAGLANGFFGAGGGLFLVPLLGGWAGLSKRQAFATSVGAALALSLASACVYLMKGALSLSGLWPYLAGGFAGGIVSGKIFGKVPVSWLRRAFGLLLIYGGIRAVFQL